MRRGTTLPPFTPAEDAIIREHYPTVGAPGVHQLMPHRSLHGIRRHARKLGVRRYAPAWTPADDETIRQQYATTPSTTLAKQLGRTTEALRDRAQHLGVTKREWWPPAQLAALRRYHARHGLEPAEALVRAVNAAGPTRTEGAVGAMASRLGLTPAALRRRRYTAEEDALILDRYPKIGSKATARALAARGYHRTPDACQRRAWQLGAPRNPVGRKIRVTYDGRRLLARDRVLHLLMLSYPIPLDHEDIAERLGIPPLSASQHLKSLRDEGAVVRLDFGTLHVPAHAHARAA